MSYFSFFLSSFLSITPQDSVSHKASNDETNTATSYTMKAIIPSLLKSKKDDVHNQIIETFSERLELTACANFFTASGSLPTSLVLS